MLKKGDLAEFVNLLNDEFGEPDFVLNGDLVIVKSVLCKLETTLPIQYQVYVQRIGKIVGAQSRYLKKVEK